MSITFFLKKCPDISLCFLIGKVVSEIKFDFILNSKDISISRFSIELENKSIVIVKGYNEIADYCYKNLITGSIVGVQGSLNSNKEIIIIDIKEFL